jgi:hypothetical protein
MLTHADPSGHEYAPHVGALFLTTYAINSARVCVETAGYAARHEKHNLQRVPNLSCLCWNKLQTAATHGRPHTV